MKIKKNNVVRIKKESCPPWVDARRVGDREFLITCLRGNTIWGNWPDGTHDKLEKIDVEKIIEENGL